MIICGGIRYFSTCDSNDIGDSVFFTEISHRPQPHMRHSSVSIRCTHNHMTSIKMRNIGFHSIYF